MKKVFKNQKILIDSVVNMFKPRVYDEDNDDNFLPGMVVLNLQQ